ncbi:nitroreductase [Thermanaerovibrio velox DSM 12556]|uniref:Nitroreductase n=1 Tax=Thermanaerovibrio velox DSM 12556 TaxID=926567 RepID=H0UP26_9BACT|nr:nitroreductase family protein [Thermanaerovibrio velox]EHM10529.1 nitroreductase [Thermanaerovibrio velox DSM 12556]
MEVSEALRQRRSINFFDPNREIPEGVLEAVLEEANLAPSSFNLQPWEVILVKDKDNKRRLRECAFNQPKVEEASAVLIVAGDPMAVENHIDPVLESMIRLGYMKAEDAARTRPMPFKLYGEPDSERRRLFAAKNASLFAMSVMVAAMGHGLSTHPMDGFDEAKVKETFGIPDRLVIPMLIAVGYLKEGVTLLPRGMRRPLEGFLHRERF